MSDFSAPADNLVREATGYLNAQLDNVKLRTVKGLSKGTSAIAKLLLIFIVAGALVTALSFAARGITTLEKAKEAQPSAGNTARPAANNPSKIMDERDLKEEDFAEWFKVDLKNG